MSSSLQVATDPATFKRVLDLYEQEKVLKFTEDLSGFVATVMGTVP